MPGALIGGIKFTASGGPWPDVSRSAPPMRLPGIASVAAAQRSAAQNCVRQQELDRRNPSPCAAFAASSRTTYPTTSGGSPSSTHESILHRRRLSGPRSQHHLDEERSRGPQSLGKAPIEPCHVGHPR